MTRKAGSQGSYLWRLIDRNTGEPVEGNDLKMVSVTTVLGAVLNKPKLYDWYYRTTVEGTEILLDGLGDYIEETAEDVIWHHDLDELLKLSRLRPEDIRDESATRGAKAHEYLELLCSYSPSLAPKTEYTPFEQGLNEWASVKLYTEKGKPRFENSEQVLYSLKHGFSGTCDLAGHGWVLDLKTRKSGQGAYFNDFVQVAAYGLAREEMTGVPHDKGTVLVVRDDATWQEYSVDMSLRQVFLDCLNVYERMKESA